ncbi:alpha-mannosidase 2-like [Amphibalanus amphitrite]|uniref:alpha-mannosidase 2-like n=1 Tax=Amphibalanus amphitrite TaxID=1232801 RepID=UPI001C9129E0|nr:alpha-mannosidase 2-like [Amphibalanus amphitrite]
MLVAHSSRLERDWRTPLTELYRTAGRPTLDSLVATMADLTNMTFTWSEVSQLHLWWYGASEESRRTLTELVRSGRLEITGGMWVQPEDTGVRLHTLVQQLVEGHQWLRQHLGVTPETGLCAGSPAAGCSSVLAHLFSQAGIEQAVVTSASGAWTEYMAAHRSVDFQWQQPWSDGGDDGSLLTHVHPTDRPSDGAGCDSEEASDFCPDVDLTQALLTADGYQNLFTHVSADNVKERAEALVAAAGRVASLSAHNVALVMVDADFHPANVSAWRERHRSLAQLTNCISEHGDSLSASAELATAARYFAAVRERLTYAAPLPRLVGELHGAAPPAETRWHRVTRRLETRLRDTELLLVWALGVHQRAPPPSAADRPLAQAARKLANCRRTVALLSRRGTAAAGVPASLAKELSATSKTLARVSHLLLSVLLLDLGRFASAADAARHYVSLDNGLSAVPRLLTVTVQPGDAHHLIVYNALPFQRSELVQFVTPTPNIAVEGPDGANVPLEISPVGRDAFTVKFVAEQLSPVSMTTYRVSSVDLDSAADPALMFGQNESDISEGLTISNERFELRLVESPHGWRLTDRRTGDELELELRLVALRPGGTELLACSDQGWSQRADSVTAEATLRCGRAQLTVRLTRATGPLGQAVSLLVESEPEVGGGISGALSWTSGEEPDADPAPLLLHLRTPLRSEGGGGSGFYADSGDYQLLFASSPLVALLSQQLASPAPLLFGSSPSAVRLRATPRLLDGPLPCDHELVSLRQLTAGADGRPAARALLTLRRRRLDCRLWDARDELGCGLQPPLPRLSPLLGAEWLSAASLTGAEGPTAPPALSGLQQVRLDADQVRSFMVALDRQLPVPKPTVKETQQKAKQKTPPPRREHVYSEGDVQFEVGQSYQLQL